MTLWLAVAASMAAGLSSCNTAIGLGRDLRALGTGMENKSYGRSWTGDSSGSAAVPQPDPYAPVY